MRTAYSRGWVFFLEQVCFCFATTVSRAHIYTYIQRWTVYRTFSVPLAVWLHYVAVGWNQREREKEKICLLPGTCVRVWAWNFFKLPDNIVIWLNGDRAGISGNVYLLRFLQLMLTILLNLSDWNFARYRYVLWISYQQLLTAVQYVHLTGFVIGLGGLDSEFFLLF